MNAPREFRLAEYGIKEAKNKQVVEVSRDAEDCYSVLLLDSETAVYAKGSAVYRKTLPDGDEKSLIKNAGTTPRLAYHAGVLAVYNKEGDVRLLDSEGRRLRELSYGGYAVRTVHFLGDQLLGYGGEQCTLVIYSLLDGQVVHEQAFGEYVVSLASNGQYLAVALASGEVYLFDYELAESTSGESAIVSTSQFSLRERSVLDLEKSAVVQFIGEDRLFIGVASGTGYVYSVADESLLGEAALHSKLITGAAYQNGWIITSSLDGKLRISTPALREVSSLHVGASLLGFSALFRGTDSATAQRLPGSQYLMTTNTGNILVYQDRWTAPPAPAAPPAAKSTTTLYRHTLGAPTIAGETVRLTTRDPLKRGKYEKLMARHQYAKALAHAAGRKDRESVSSMLQYVHHTPFYLTTLSLLTDDQLAMIGDMCIDYLRHPSYFEVAESVLHFCSTMLLARETPKRSPLQAVLDRGIQELEEEYLVQSTGAALSAYLNSVVS